MGDAEALVIRTGVRRVKLLLYVDGERGRERGAEARERKRKEERGERRGRLVIGKEDSQL